ncbi:MAG: DUF4145 domain-containing protein [Anaerolineales bacterium]
MSDTTPPKRERIACNSCNQETWHELVASHTATFPIYQLEETEDGLSRWHADDLVERWDIFHCLGCDTVTIKITTKDPTDEESGYYWNFLPRRNKKERIKKVFHNTPTHLNRLYNEIISTYNQELLVLCAGGIRALLEGICADKKIKQGITASGQIRDTLEGKINGLTAIVPAGIVKNLHGLRFLGNRALHELETPNKADLELALTVIEDILNVVYDLDYRAGLLHKRFKPRRKARKRIKKAAPPKGT